LWRRASENDLKEMESFEENEDSSSSS